MRSDYTINIWLNPHVTFFTTTFPLNGFKKQNKKTNAIISILDRRFSVVYKQFVEIKKSI